MGYKFNDEDKVESEFNNNYFGYGVHKVQLMLFTADHMEDGREYVDVDFCDPNDGEKVDKVRMWFVGGAAPISFNNLRQIAVHNASEANKEKARMAVEETADSEALVELLNDKLIGKEAWFTKYMDPKRTYIGKDGQTRKSVNKNLYGYEPKLNESLMPAPADEQGNPLAGSTPASDDAKANIPKDWA